MIRFDESQEQFFIDRIGQFSESLEELDDDYAIQATLCIQLALIEHFHATGLTLPILLTDQWTHPIRKFAAETVHLLNDLGKNSERQFLVVTWDDATAEFYNECGQPVLVVEREEEHIARELVDAELPGYDSAINWLDKPSYERSADPARQRNIESVGYDEIDAF
jgi:hypothetical protein